MVGVEITGGVAVATIAGVALGVEGATTGAEGGGALAAAAAANFALALAGLKGGISAINVERNVALEEDEVVAAEDKVRGGGIGETAVGVAEDEAADAAAASLAGSFLIIEAISGGIGVVS